MKKNSTLILVTGLILGWAVDLFFYKKPFGVAFSVWIGLALMGLFIIGAIEKVKPSARTIILAIATLTFSLGPLFRLETMSRFLSSSAALLLLMLTAATYRHGFWWWYRIVDYFSEFMQLIGAAFSRAWHLLFPERSSPDPALEAEDSSQKPVRKASIWPVVRGIALALPVIIILAALLASADAVFEEGLVEFLKFFNIENLVEILFRFFYVLLFAYLFSGVLLHAVRAKKEAHKPDPNKSFIQSFLGMTESTIILSAVNLLFLIFLIIQFRYFFGGQANIHAGGYTYAEYARRGFNELVTVAVISVLLYVSLSTATKTKTTPQRNLFTLLSGLLFIQVLIILFSSFQRLALYESAYGFSRLRTYSTFFIPWLAILILILLGLEVARKQGRLALALVLVSAGYTATLLLINVDRFIALRNIERASISSSEGFALDGAYLMQLSNDIVPVMVQAAQNPEPGIANPSLAFLVCRWNEVKSQKDMPWQGFSIPAQQAKRLLSAQQAQLEQYPLVALDPYDLKGVVIDGDEYLCSGNLYMD